MNARKGKLVHANIPIHALDLAVRIQVETIVAPTLKWTSVACGFGLVNIN